MEIKPGRVSSYRMTIDVKSEDDQNALDDLRLKVHLENVSDHNKVNGQKLRVVLRYRKPEFNYPGWDQKYGAGGGVRLCQNPSHADVYIQKR